MLCSTSQDQQQENSSLGGGRRSRQRVKTQWGRSEKMLGRGQGWLPEQIGYSSCRCVFIADAVHACSFYKARTDEVFQALIKPNNGTRFGLLFVFFCNKMLHHKMRSKKRHILITSWWENRTNSFLMGFHQSLRIRCREEGIDFSLWLCFYHLSIKVETSKSKPASCRTISISKWVHLHLAWIPWRNTSSHSNCVWRYGPWTCNIFTCGKSEKVWEELSASGLRLWLQNQKLTSLPGLATLLHVRCIH